MKTIPVLKFTPPNGDREWITCEVPDDEFEHFESARAHGLRLTVEMLRTGEISMCLEHPELGDFDQVICANGQVVVEKRRDLLMRFSPSDMEQFVEAMS